MKWRSIRNAPNTGDNLRVLLAEFRGSRLKRIVPGWWYQEESGGFFAPAKPIPYTHWMPYEEYWKTMEKLIRS